ncbi:MAG: hypothetical protein NW226_05195, partial [Microscillaceae bacterium]|nr:hypothetical protein [Microscillaceae bacterium]
ELISFSGSNDTTISANLSSLLSGPGVAITLFRFSVEADATADAANNFSFDNFRIFDAAATPQITGFTLINSLTEGDIALLNDGDVLVSNELPTDLINIRADIDGLEVGSVGFELTGPNLGVSPARFENVAPFALFGDVNSNYNGVRLKPGQYTLKATAYSGANGEGSELSSAEITFTIILNTTPQIAEIVLFNAETDKEVAVLTDGAQIDLSQVGTNNLTIVARTSPKTVGSVKLALSGPLNINRVENLAPYALFGDSNNSTGDLFGQAFTAGSYSITATAYNESNATGANSSQTVQFELIGGTGLTVFPNITSSSSRTTVKREGINNSGKAVVLTITDMLGRTMGTAIIQVGKDSTVLNLNNVPEGQYIISDGVSQTRMTVEN